MANLTIRRLDDRLKEQLRIRAATHGRSMEEEARVILKSAIESQLGIRTMGDAFRAYFGPEHGVEIELPPRELDRDPPDFSE